LTVVLIAAVIAAAVVWGAKRIAGEIKLSREEAVRGRALDLLRLLSPAIGAAQSDPKSLLGWQPLANVARQLFPAELDTLDRAANGTFPFSKAQIEAAHAQWTTEWLAWERAHDAEYKLKASALEQELAALSSSESSSFSPGGSSSIVRARLDAVEREKLETYQRRYSEYVRVAKALQGLIN
jgi:hypothetical protein